MDEKKMLRAVDELMNAITQTDAWFEAMENNPAITRTENNVNEIIRRLGLSPEQENKLTGAFAEELSAYSDAATLYGIYVSGALHYGAAHSDKVAAVVEARLKEGR